MEEQISNYDQPIQFVIGFAGSGKSTELASRATKKTLILTPTHKAKSVLQDKGLTNIFTIYSVLKLVPTLNKNYDPSKKQKMQRLSQIGDVSLKDITDVFIDEYSMINMSILDLLLNVLPSTCKVTIFGDAYQLPPVEGEPIEPELYTDDIVELTTQYRAEAPEVVDSFMRMMMYLKTGDHNIDLRLNAKIKGGSLANFNPETDRALAFTNAKVADINAEIAYHLGLPKEYAVGEQLTANSVFCSLSDGGDDSPLFPNCIAKGKLMEGEKLASTVSATLGDMYKYNTDISEYSTCNIEVDDEVFSIYYDINHYATQRELKEDIDEAQRKVYNANDIGEDEDLSKWCRLNRSAEGVRERGKAWSRFIAHSNLVFNLQRPFATTVHKAQGSEFSTVYIAQNDIKRSIRRGYYGMYARLMYVALSRAIKKVVIV